MRFLAYWYLRLRGWSFVGEVPDVPKMIVIGAPHTSNWDFIFFLGALHHFGLTVRYLGKAELFAHHLAGSSSVGGESRSTGQRPAESLGKQRLLSIRSGR